MWKDELAVTNAKSRGAANQGQGQRRNAALKGSAEESSAWVIDGQRVRIRGPYISRIGRTRSYYYY